MERGHAAEANTVLTREAKAPGSDMHVGMGTCLSGQGLQVTSCILLDYSNDSKKLTESKEILFTGHCHLPIYNVSIQGYT